MQTDLATLQELSHVTQKEDKWKAEYKYCFEPLQIIGDIAPRQRELTDEDVFRVRCQDPASVAAKREEAITSVAWCNALAVAAEKKELQLTSMTWTSSPPLL